MKYIRTKDGHIFEVVDYEQLDENTKKNVRQHRYVGLEDYLNEKIFVKIHKNMPNPISQYQSIKMFKILNQADTIEELCDEFVSKDFERIITKEQLFEYRRTNVMGAIWTDKGLIYIAKMKGVLPNGEIDWELL